MFRKKPVDKPGLVLPNPLACVRAFVTDALQNFNTGFQGGTLVLKALQFLPGGNQVGVLFFQG